MSVFWSLERKVPGIICLLAVWAGSKEKRRKAPLVARNGRRLVGFDLHCLSRNADFYVVGFDICSRHCPGSQQGMFSNLYSRQDSSMISNPRSVADSSNPIVDLVDVLDV